MCMVIKHTNGIFEEAEVILKGMPVEAKSPVCVALLQACKVHGNEEMLDWIRGIFLMTKMLVLGRLLCYLIIMHVLKDGMMLMRFVVG